ncbi:hypothetical protein F4678DRAFT_457831 [Xylaria arbuscula]|nr:hypothetical protein F4678DRAFT_457831 [Xylaria arbuscula]
MSYSSPDSNRTVAVRPSPTKPLKTLGRIIFGPLLVSPSPSDTTKSDEEEEDETQSISSSISGPRNLTKQSRRKPILASLKNSRERQSARVNRVNHLIRFIEEIQNEGYVGEKEVIPKQLFPKDYIELLVEVDERDQEFQHYFHHGLRYEYRESIHGKNQFTILMLSAFHITMQTEIDGRPQEKYGLSVIRRWNSSRRKPYVEIVLLATGRTITHIHR